MAVNRHQPRNEPQEVLWQFPLTGSLAIWSWGLRYGGTLLLGGNISCLGQDSHCGLVTPYGNMDLGQHWRRQAITWIDVDLSSKVFCGIHLRLISQEVVMNLICNLCLENHIFNMTATSPRDKELRKCSYIMLHLTHCPLWDLKNK